MRLRFHPRREHLLVAILVGALMLALGLLGTGSSQVPAASAVSAPATAPVHAVGIVGTHGSAGEGREGCAGIGCQGPPYSVSVRVGVLGGLGPRSTRGGSAGWWVCVSTGLACEETGP
jgi:hypothetical protein